jgi:hypothetical protein
MEGYMLFARITADALPTPAHLEERFLAFMGTVGYAATQARIEDHPLIEGWSMVNRAENFGKDYLLLFTDQWGGGGGFTTIEMSTAFDHRTLLWCMTYSGTYPKHLIPHLKTSLAAAYVEKKFYGGRGPPVFRPSPTVEYQNHHQGPFTQFSGFEVLSENPGSAGDPSAWTGGHRYWGGMMPPFLPA